MMKRILAFILTACVLFAGCGTDTSAGRPDTASAEDIFTSLSENLPSYDTQDTAIVAKLLGIDADSIVSGTAAFAKDGGPEMLIVLENIDEDAALKTGERMNYYLTTLQNSASQYAPEQVDLLKQGYVYTAGKYAVMYVGEQTETVKKELAKLLH